MISLLMGAVVAATTVKAIGVVIAVVTGIAVVAYILINLRQGRPEIGAEIELAPNRKPYYDGEQLEGPRLNRALASGLVLVAITAVGLPLYWPNAPARPTDADGEFVATVTWRAPALDTVLLRFSLEELEQILVYGRPGTPMPAWGTDGGGPLTPQQIDELMAYIGSIQLTSDEAKDQVEGQVRDELGLEEDAEIDWDDPATGKALFNLGLEDGFAG